MLSLTGSAFVWRGAAGIENVLLNFDAETDIAQLRLSRLAEATPHG